MRKKQLDALPPESEDSLQAKVMGLARVCGWRRVHFRAARTAKGWRTPFTGDEGFPDTVLVRGCRLIFAECKSDAGTYGPGQLDWLADLEVTGLVEVYTWRPADWNEIVKILS